MDVGNIVCSTCTRVHELEAEIERLKGVINERDETIRAMRENRTELVRKVNMSSQNSSIPSSKDRPGVLVHKTLRENSDLNPGGQPGHEGRNIVLPHEPNEVVDHHPEDCSSCPNFAKCCEDSVFKCKECRYVIDLVVATKVTEHRVLEADCPNCPGSGCGNVDREEAGGNKRLKGVFPEDVKAYIQYGENITIAVGLLDTYGFMSDSRISTLIRDMCGISLSAGTVVSMCKRCADKVKPALKIIKNGLIRSDVDHFDETMLHHLKEKIWLHSSSNSRYTYQTLHAKRGVEGIKANGVLSKFKGVAVHDCWGPYFRFKKKHALCCAHLLRELNSIIENYPEHRWAQKFKDLLLSMKKLKEHAIEKGKKAFGRKTLDFFKRRYDAILDLADMECPPPPPPEPGKRGRKKKGVEKALIDRLREYESEVCYFVRSFRVPFDNNQAERDVRYAKIKAKISGNFRSMDCAQDFIDLVSYLSSSLKNGVGAYDAMRKAFAKDFNHLM